MIEINDFTIAAIEKNLKRGLKISNFVEYEALDPFYLTNYCIDFDYKDTVIHTNVLVRRGVKLSFEDFVNDIKKQIDNFFNILKIENVEEYEISDFIYNMLYNRFRFFYFDGDLFDIYVFEKMNSIVDKHIKSVVGRNNNKTLDFFDIYRQCVEDFEIKIVKPAIKIYMKEYGY